jgi:Tfp pilus assembly protein PilF
MTTRSYCLPSALLLLVLTGCNSMSGRMNNDIGQMFYRGGNYAMARGEFGRAVANDPYNADYVHNLAMATRRQGDPAGAEKMLRKALDIDPAHQPSYHGLALVMKDQGRTAEAQELLSGWVAQQPYSHQAHVEMAWLQREMGDTAGAQASLQNALKIKPNDPVATAHLGQIYQDTNQPQLAQAMYRKSLATKFYQPELQARLASMNQGHVHGMQLAGGQGAMTGPVMANGAFMNGSTASYPYASAGVGPVGSTAAAYSPGSFEMSVPAMASSTASPYASQSISGQPVVAPAMVAQPMSAQPFSASMIGTTNPAIPSTLADGAPFNLPADANGLQPVAAGAPLGGDPAHAGDTTADLPVVSPY